MSKFNTKSGAATAKVAAAPKSALRSTGVATTTYEGGRGFETDAKTELFRLAVTNMVGEPTFYESGPDRDNRFRNLVHQVTAEDPEWIQRFIPFLREKMFMRSASIVLAAEYAAAGGPNVRQVVNSAMARADEPGEFIGYWLANYGRTFAGGKQRGVADALVRLVNEYSALKYDGTGNEIRLGDTIELAHPKAKDEAQNALFKALLDRRHRGSEAEYNLDLLPKWKLALDIDKMSPERFSELLDAQNAADTLNEAGYTWERLSSKTKMDKRAWEAIIPSMGVMALMRNLRNFDQAEISTDARNYVIGQLSNPEVIAKSKLFPYRFWSAYRFTESAHYISALEQGLGHATHNVPELSGRTLVLIDVSGSMQSPLSMNSKIAVWEPAAVFAAVQAMKSDNVDLVAFATGSKEIPFGRGASVMRLVEKVQADVGNGVNGHGTETFPAIAKHYNGQDRIVIFSDLQSFGAGNMWSRTDASLEKRVDEIPVPIYSFDLRGYKAANFNVGQKNRYLLAGFSDAVFTMMSLLEQGDDAGWPF